jgi:hypothetical protein
VDVEVGGYPFGKRAGAAGEQRLLCAAFDSEHRSEPTRGLDRRGERVQGHLVDVGCEGFRDDHFH